MNQIIVSGISPLFATIIFLCALMLTLSKYLWKVAHTIDGPHEYVVSKDKKVLVKFYKEKYGKKYQWSVVTNEEYGETELLEIIDYITTKGDYEIEFHPNNRFFASYARYKNKLLEIDKNE